LKSAQAHVPSVTLPDRESFTFIRVEEWEVPPAEPFLAAKKAFIVDARAISYAETCLSIIERYELGSIVGGASAGTNGNANTFSLPGGYTVAWTGMKSLKHDGSRHHGIGVHPTIPVSRTRAAIVAGRDELLEAAVLAVKN
jgi:C-terminal processing protease CtpA/Prc